MSARALPAFEERATTGLARKQRAHLDPTAGIEQQASRALVELLDLPQRSREQLAELVLADAERRSIEGAAEPMLEVRVRRHIQDTLARMLTAFGAAAVTFMMLMYALERRRSVYILAFACGCALSSAYGFLAGTWPFGVVEAIWAAIAARRYWNDRRTGSASPGARVESH